MIATGCFVKSPTQYGMVVGSGIKAFIVEWESGKRNRYNQHPRPPWLKLERPRTRDTPVKLKRINPMWFRNWATYHYGEMLLEALMKDPTEATP